MWSVWSEAVDIYLGQGISMLKTASQETMVMQHPVTLPLERVLAKLADALGQGTQGSGAEQSHPRIKRRKLRITLSAALCPAIGFNAPPEVTRWHERQEIAKATAAATLAMSAEQITCETDAFRPGVTTALALPLLAELKQWASQQHAYVASVHPLWAVATQCAAAHQNAVQGLLLDEPDSLTLLAEDDQGRLNVLTLVHEPDPAARQASLRRWLISVGLSEDKLLKLSFDPQPNTLMPQGPNVWTAHWSSP